MADTIRFDVNTPQEMAFSYPSGREVEGRYGTQFYRGTVDGRAVYLEPGVEERLKELNVAKGERVQICKRSIKEGRSVAKISWEVKRVDAPGQPEPVNGAPAKNTPPATPHQLRPNGTPQSITAPAPAQTDKPVIHTQTSALMSGALVASIDALTTATHYGRTKGLNLQFNEEDVRAVALTIYINASKQVSTWQQ